MEKSTKLIVGTIFLVGGLIAANKTNAFTPCGFVVLRLKADNPGMWLFHCHISWEA